VVKKKSWRQDVIDNKGYVNPPSTRFPELSGKTVRLVPATRDKIIAKVVADAETLENRNNTNRETAKQARIERGLRTKATIKTVMERHPKDAKPRDIWPDVRDAVGELNITEAHFREVRLEILKSK
jgi:hypothetical protein